jgi:hypothetical protein
MDISCLSVVAQEEWHYSCLNDQCQVVIGFQTPELEPCKQSGKEEKEKWVKVCLLNTVSFTTPMSVRLNSVISYLGNK